MNVVIETPRLLVRPLVADDLDDLARLYADPEVRRYFPDRTLDREQTREQLEWFANGDNPGYPDCGLWATIDKATGAFAGRSGLLRWEIDGREETEIAYMLGQEFWGRGLGNEVAAALVRHGFERLRLARLIALVHPDNRASIATAEKAGLSFERAVEIEGSAARLYSIHRRVTPE
ncbi:GNAT family N-acetyltransferase [Rhizobium sp.]